MLSTKRLTRISNLQSTDYLLIQMLIFDLLQEKASLFLY